MIKQLVKLSNHLDAKGLRREADYLDGVIIRVQDIWVRDHWLELVTFIAGVLKFLPDLFIGYTVESYYFRFSSPRPPETCFEGRRGPLAQIRSATTIQWSVLILFKTSWYV